MMVSRVLVFIFPFMTANGLEAHRAASAQSAVAVRCSARVMRLITATYSSTTFGPSALHLGLYEQVNIFTNRLVVIIR